MSLDALFLIAITSSFLLKILSINRVYAYVWDYVKRLAYYYFFLEKFFLREPCVGNLV